MKMEGPVIQVTVSYSRQYHNLLLNYILTAGHVLFHRLCICKITSMLSNLISFQFVFGIYIINNIPNLCAVR